MRNLHAAYAIALGLANPANPDSGRATMGPMQLSIVVPTYNEAPNIAELVRRVSAAVDVMNSDALAGTGSTVDVEIVFVDDSIDDTAAVARAVSASSTIPITVIHRERRTGGLGGAVVAGLQAASYDVCVVMDADLQHPPETIAELLEAYSAGDVDLVVASRYAGTGTSRGLSDRTRVFVSRASTALTRAMFPIRLRGVSDPMTGFFLVDRRALEIDTLRPRGFKILLEILARKTLRVAEVPFHFAARHAGDSKASLRQGGHFLAQLTALRFGKMSLFAVIGGLGAVANLAIMWGLTRLGVDYIVAAIIAAEATIIGNFLLQERFVFQDMRGDAAGVWSRFVKSFTFNNAEAVIRIPVIALMVETGHFSSVVAAAITLAAAFVLRFVFHSLVVYAPRRTGVRAGRVREIVDELDAQAMSPGEL